jgi:hypothetical protein
MSTVATSPGWRTLRRGFRTIREEASTTPGRLRLLSVLIAGGAALLWIVGSTLLYGSRSTLDRVGRGTVPAIIATQQIHSALSDADRAAANAFLSGGIEIVEPRTQYEIDIATATQELEQAAEQNRAGARATEQIQAIDALLAQYVGLVETARANNRQGFPVGVAYLRDASRLMHRPGNGILAGVDLLGTLNAQDLADQESALTFDLAATGVFFALAAVLGGLLIHTQVFVARRFRRRINDHLLAATVLLAVVTAWTGGQAVHTAVAASVAQAAYGRLHDLWLARSLANDADGNVSLSLIALGEGDEFDQAFAAETHRLVDRPLTDQLVGDASRGRVRFGGLLADEVRTASLPGEREAAMRALRTYRQFLQADAAVRAGVAAGTPDAAVAIALGTSPGQLAVTFGELDEALGDEIVIEQQQFDGAAGDAASGLGLDIGLPALALVIALLTFSGLEPRIGEYRA